MPQTTSPRDRSHRHQPAGHRPPRVSSPSMATAPPPRDHPIASTTASYRHVLPRAIRPYPQPGRSHSSPSSMPPPRIIAPPPHVLPQSHPTTAAHRPRPLPQVSYTRPTDAESSPLADLADVAMTMPPVIPWRRIYPAVIPDIPNGLPQYPPRSLADSPHGTVRPQVLPPLSSMLESAAPIQVPVTRVVRHWMSAQPPQMQLSPAIASPHVDASTVSRVADSSQSTGTPPLLGSSSSSPTIMPDRTSQEPSPPLSNASSTMRKRRLGEPSEEGSSSPRPGPLANLTLSGPTSPDRAKASRDWHEASRRMLHPRSVWSPETPTTPLPDKEIDESDVDMKKRNETCPSEDDKLERPEPRSLPQTPAMNANPVNDSQETKASIARRDNPRNYMFPELVDPNDSQETTQEEIITPSSSFRVDASPTVEKDDPFPPLVSPLSSDNAAIRRASEPAAVEPKLPLVVKPLDHPDGKAGFGRFGTTT